MAQLMGEGQVGDGWNDGGYGRRWMGGGGTDRRWMGIVEWGQSGVGRWDIRKME